ncbi:MAG: seg [archaeon GW2011_AR5]|nr:MAG: seg [archaeon GW2011_AR5]
MITQIAKLNIKCMDLCPGVTAVVNVTSVNTGFLGGGF